MRRQVCGSVQPDYRNEAPRDERLEDVPVVVGARFLSYERDRAVVAQDLRLESSQLGPGLDAQLVHEPPPGVLVSVKRLCLAS